MRKGSTAPMTSQIRDQRARRSAEAVLAPIEDGRLRNEPSSAARKAFLSDVVHNSDASSTIEFAAKEVQFLWNRPHTINVRGQSARCQTFMHGFEISLEILKVVLGWNLPLSRVVQHLPNGDTRISCSSGKRQLSVGVLLRVVLELPVSYGPGQELPHRGRAIRLFHILYPLQVLHEFLRKPCADHLFLFHPLASLALFKISVTTDGESHITLLSS